MNSKLKLEKRILNISFVVSLLFLIAEIIVAIITRSNSVLMDCVHDFADLIMIGPFLILVPLLSKSVTEKRPYGYSQVESLLIMFKSGFLIVVTLLLVVNSIKLIISGGNEVDATTIALFELIVSFICVIMYFLLTKLRGNYSSPSIDAELYIWKLDSFSTLGVGLAFVFKYFIDKTSYSFIGPYIDPGIAILLAFILLKEPIGLFVDSVRSLILFAPDNNTRSKIKNTVSKTLEKNNCYINFLDIIKTGRKIWVEVYFVTDNDLVSINKIRKMHDEILNKLKNEYNIFIELIPDIGKVKAVNLKKMNNLRRLDKITKINRKSKY